MSSLERCPLFRVSCSNACIVPSILFHIYVRADVEVAFGHAEEVLVYESQAVFNVCLTKHGESSCPVSALVTTCSSISLDLPPATSEWEGGVCLCEGERGVCLCEGEVGVCLCEGEGGVCLCEGEGGVCLCEGEGGVCLSEGEEGGV